MRHHGGVAGECAHGFAPGTCLICQTLNPATASKPSRTLTKATDRPPTQLARPSGRSPAKAADPASSPRVVPAAAPRTGAGVKLAMLTVAVIALIVAGWVALHLVFAVLHIVELIGVALVALYLGWVAGVFHGRRTASKK